MLRSECARYVRAKFVVGLFSFKFKHGPLKRKLEIFAIGTRLYLYRSLKFPKVKFWKILENVYLNFLVDFRLVSKT